MITPVMSYDKSGACMNIGHHVNQYFSTFFSFLLQVNHKLRPKKIPVVPVTCHEKIRVGRSENIF